MDSLSTRLAKRLDELDRSYSWLAKQVDVHRGTVARWAAGSMAVASEHRAPVARALGAKVGDLFDADGNAKPYTPRRARAVT